eukprot:6241343-Prymnesium_polylepis.3
MPAVQMRRDGRNTPKHADTCPFSAFIAQLEQREDAAGAYVSTGVLQLPCLLPETLIHSRTQKSDEHVSHLHICRIGAQKLKPVRVCRRVDRQVARPVSFQERVALNPSWRVTYQHLKDQLQHAAWARVHVRDALQYITSSVAVQYFLPSFREFEAVVNDAGYVHDACAMVSLDPAFALQLAALFLRDDGIPRPAELELRFIGHKVFGSDKLGYRILRTQNVGSRAPRVIDALGDGAHHNAGTHRVLHATPSLAWIGRVIGIGSGGVVMHPASVRILTQALCNAELQGTQKVGLEQLCLSAACALRASPAQPPRILEDFLAATAGLPTLAGCLTERLLALVGQLPRLFWVANDAWDHHNGVLYAIGLLVHQQSSRDALHLLAVQNLKTAAAERACLRTRAVFHPVAAVSKPEAVWT